MTASQNDKMRAAEPVLITGAGGFVGAHLARNLLQDGISAAGVVRSPAPPLRLRHLAPALPLFHGDLTEAEFVHDLFGRYRPKTVFHFASTPFNPPTIPVAEHFAAILQITGNILSAATAHPPARIVHTSTALVYGQNPTGDESSPLMPTSIYGGAKAAAALLAEGVARAQALDLVELRLYTPYGPWERANRLIPTLLHRLDHGMDIHLQGGSQQRDYVYIDDVVDACIKAATAEIETPAAFNIGAGAGVAIRDLTDMLMKIHGKTVPVHVDTAMRPDEVLHMAANRQAALARLGWQPAVSLEDGLGRTVAWYNKHRDDAAHLT